MNARELRRKYFDFFISKDGREFPSAGLVPVDALGNEDDSLLFTSAGMVQFKPFFLGVAQPPHTRLTTAQKCLRTTDIESTGNLSHLTFFEMMGNFSFGDYFKRESIEWAWEFLKDWLKLDMRRLRVTVYKDDEDAYTIWRETIGLPPERVARFDEDKNYWPGGAITHGPNGPCGPCSEIYYDMFPDQPFDHEWNGEGDRWLEIWNLVFMQFTRSGDFVVNNQATKEGHWENIVLTPLPKQNIDTGMGLERTAAALGGFPSVYETDVFAPIITRIEQLYGRPYAGSPEPVRRVFRIIADHIRSATFCISDGVLPSNNDRGYVLRRLIRRAVLKGQRQLGFERPFFADVFPAVEQAMSDQYPELTDRREFIVRTLRDEEEQFRLTLADGIKRAERMELTGQDAFMLYDTYGFPLEVTEELAAERGRSVDLEEFYRALDEQRKRSKAAGGIAIDVFNRDADAVQEMLKTLPATRFLGYDTHETKATILGMVANGESVPSAAKGATVEIALDQTPFYAEAGGPVGDTGTLTGANGAARALDTQKTNDRWVHIGEVTQGEIRVGDKVVAAVDIERRRDIMRNHTATHLLHAALRRTLGGHVHQAGSLVAPDHLRFDFTHNKALTDDELSAIERLVNEQTLDDLPVTPHNDMPLSEARARGAMALFGEKYGERVRMIEIADTSRELCGGIHVAHTSQIGLFKIVSEGSVASGVRRITAVTGKGAYEYATERDRLLRETARALRSTPSDTLTAIERLHDQVKLGEKRLEQIRTSGTAAGDSQTLELNGASVVVRKAEHTDGKTAGALADRLAQQHPGAAIVIGASDNGKVMFVAKVADALVSRGVHAGNLVREIASIAGGSGGGRPDFAQAGAKDSQKLDEALAAVGEIISKQLGG